MHADEHLEYWGDRFVAAGLAELMQFQAFMALTSARKRRLLGSVRVMRSAIVHVERLEPEAELHGLPLAPMRPRDAAKRQPWYVTVRNRLRRRRAPR